MMTRSDPNGLSAFERALSAVPKPNASAVKIPAARTFTILPEHFADTWENKPIEGIVLGIRVPSEADVQGARIEADKVARNALVESDEDRIGIFNDTLLACAVASAICDPNDVSSPHPFFDMAEDMVPLALKSKTIQYIFDLVEILHIEQSPIFPEITTEEEAKLVALLSESDPYNGVDRLVAMKARRILRYALDLLEE